MSILKSNIIYKYLIFRVRLLNPYNIQIYVKPNRIYFNRCSWFLTIQIT